MPASFTRNRLALRGIWFHRRLAVSMALGVATAAAVIIGALVVGDSMRGSLRALTIDRLGSIDQLVIPGGFFHVEGIPQSIHARDVVSTIYFDKGVVETAGNAGNTVRRATSVQIFGIEPSFGKLDITQPVFKTVLNDEEVILNQAAASELQVVEGDTVTVRLPSEQAVPADSPLGKRDSQTEGIPRLKVVAIIENRGLGRFAMHPSQVEPLVAFLNRETIAAALDRSGQANCLVVSTASKPSVRSISSAQDDWVDELPLRLSDYGLKLSRVTQSFEAQGRPLSPVFDYYNLTSDRLLLQESAVESIQKTFLANNRPQACMTYLANAIERLGDNDEVVASVPYSTFSAIDSAPSFPLDYGMHDDAGSSNTEPLPMVINQWTAKALTASVGDRLRIAYFEPEVQAGREIERTVDAVVTSIVPITEPITPYRRSRPPTFAIAPTIYNDPDLTPSVPGVTDQDSISDWDLPFKLVREISSEDDRYWANHRLTPKAFIPLLVGQTLFGSRFGKTTSLRFPVSSAATMDDLDDQIMAALRPIRKQLGWAAIMVRENQLAASRGTTPFDALFLSLSFFVILAAVLLISLLFRLGLLQRAGEYGLLLATGWDGKSVNRIAIREGLWTTFPGILLGVLGGLAYAWAVLWALRTWWVGAVTVPFLEFHVRWQSIVIGGVSTLFVSLLTLWLTARRLRRSTPQALLIGQLESDAMSTSQRATFARRSNQVAMALILISVVALGIGSLGNGLAQAGAFVGAGMMLLIAVLLLVHGKLSAPQVRNVSKVGNYRLVGLAAGNLRRNPLRSTLSIALMAIATFLIVSMGSFQLRPTDSGVGGFSLIGRTSTPLYRDLNDPVVRSELLGNDRDRIASTKVVSLRVKEGQDASCNNLYQASRPQVLSVPPSMAADPSRTPFDWAAFSKGTEPVSDKASPWKLLEAPASGTIEEPLPVILDQNTAMWSLQLRKGVGEKCSFEWIDGKPIHFVVVGLLANSVLQGSLLIGEANFEKVFPEVNGYQFFLLDTLQPDNVTRIFENRLSDIGMDLTSSTLVLERLMAVQNTYLKTFQSLGALGLLLGTLGLAIAQLRSAVERRGELAVLRAIGFSRLRLAHAVMLETTALLGLGIGCGLVCAVVAVSPHLFIGQTLPPVIQPLIAVASIAGIGMIAGFVTVASVVRMPLIESLRHA